MNYTKTLWNTKLVEETLEKITYGAPTNMDCFYQRDPELKSSNLTFQLTHEEEQEFINCSTNINHFVETYCKFLNDKGRTTVKLREYQEDILDTIAEEKWIEEIEDFGPNVKNFILMSSRQTGKCVLPTTQITIKNTTTNAIKKISILDLYNALSNQKNFKLKILHKIKSILYKIYNKIS